MSLELGRVFFIIFLGAGWASLGERKGPDA